MQNNFNVEQQHEEDKKIHFKNKIPKNLMIGGFANRKNIEFSKYKYLKMYIKKKHYN